MSSELRRDKNGRWLPGTSGNENGRPRRKPRADMSDTTAFAQYASQVAIRGEPTWITNHELNLLKLMESSAKGRVQAQIYLDKKFEQASRDRAALQLEVERFLNDCDREYEEKGDLRDMPVERFRIMEQAVRALRASFEGEPYPRSRKRRKH